MAGLLAISNPGAAKFLQDAAVVATCSDHADRIGIWHARPAVDAVLRQMLERTNVEDSAEEKLVSLAPFAVLFRTSFLDGLASAVMPTLETSEFGPDRIEYLTATPDAQHGVMRVEGHAKKAPIGLSIELRDSLSLTPVTHRWPGGRALSSAVPRCDSETAVDIEADWIEALIAVLFPPGWFPLHQTIAGAENAPSKEGLACGLTAMLPIQELDAGRRTKTVFTYQTLGFGSNGLFAGGTVSAGVARQPSVSIYETDGAVCATAVDMRGTLTYAWSAKGATLSAANQVCANVIPASGVRSYSVTVTVGDEDGDTATATDVIQVGREPRPTLLCRTKPWLCVD